MALVDAVPAGIYGRAALRAFGVWDQVQDRTAQTDNVRAALRLVSVGAAPLGIVYATDAAADPNVRVLGVFPKRSHPPILYPAARLARDDTDAARAFYTYLTGPAARAVFDRHGFGVPQKGGT
jgi:molybdate transport system substrate-binding protein